MPLWGHAATDQPPELHALRITTEYLLDFFIRRQVTPGSALFDDLPLFIGDAVTCAPPFNLVDRRSFSWSSSADRSEISEGPSGADTAGLWE
jgi:hypothetical protein